MKIYKSKNVLEEALDRIRYLYDEFEEVVVSISGGKDSTVVFYLTLQVAKEKNRLPLKTMWIDQETEWQGTVDYCTKIMTMPEVEPYWFQMPMVITNNANSYERYNYCWAEDKEEDWIHPKHELSIKENKYGTMRFHELFGAIAKVEFGNKKTAMIAGVRTEEAPKRAVALTNSATYKWITWGKGFATKDIYTFYPVYDWSFRDVWKYIHDNKLEYNKVYDKMYSMGVSVNDMRISNLHHETAIQVLLIVQEIEPETWNKVSKRIEGANTIKHLRKNSFTVAKELPYMFSSWEEYAMYLKENIVQDQENKDKIDAFIKKDAPYNQGNDYMKDAYYQAVINTILSADWDFTKIQNFRMNPHVYMYYKFRTKRYDNITEGYQKVMKFFTPEEKEEFEKEYQAWKQLKKASKKS